MSWTYVGEVWNSGSCKSKSFDRITDRDFSFLQSIGCDDETREICINLHFFGCRSGTTQTLKKVQNQGLLVKFDQHESILLSSMSLACIYRRLNIKTNIILTRLCVMFHLNASRTHWHNEAREKKTKRHLALCATEWIILLTSHRVHRRAELTSAHVE